MKSLILSVFIYLFVFDISIVNANQTSKSANIPSHSSDSVEVAGFFNDILQGIIDLNNTIRGVRSTINEFNRLQDEINGKNPANFRNNLPNSPTFIPQQNTPIPNNQQPQYQQYPQGNQQLNPQEDIQFPTNQQPQYQEYPPIITNPNP